MKSTTLLSELAVRETNWWCSKAGQNAGVLICSMQQGDDRWYICVYMNIVRLKVSIYFPFLFSLILLCACAVNVYVCSHVCIHVYVFACVYTSQADTRCLLSQISTLCVSVGYSNDLELPSSYLSALLMEFLFLPQGCWDYKQSSCLPGFYVHFGTQTPVFILA